MNLSNNTLRLVAPCDFEQRTAQQWAKKIVTDLRPEMVTVEIDLSRTRSMDSSGMTALLSLHEKQSQNQGQIRLINPSSVVTQLLELTRMHRLFTIVKGHGITSPGTAKSILIAEDEALILNVAELSLRPLGHPILTAGNGQEAIHLARRELPALILLDYVMPLMDGHETLRRLKSDAATKDIPVIVMSASEKIARGVYENFEGASCFVTKPFSPSALRSEAHRLIQKNLEASI